MRQWKENMHGGIQIYVQYIRLRQTENPYIYSDIQLLVAKIKKQKYVSPRLWSSGWSDLNNLKGFKSKKLYYNIVKNTKYKSIEIIAKNYTHKNFWLILILVGKVSAFQHLNFWISIKFLDFRIPVFKFREDIVLRSFKQENFQS